MQTPVPSKLMLTSTLVSFVARFTLAARAAQQVGCQRRHATKPSCTWPRSSLFSLLCRVLKRQNVHLLCFFEQA